MVLDHDRLVDLPGVGDELRHRHACGCDPLPLLVPVGFPAENRPVPIGRHLQLGEPAGAHVLHEGAVGDDDDVPVQELPGALLEVVEVLVAHDLVGLGEREGIVVLRAVSDGQSEGLESHLPGTVENLKRRVGAERGDRNVAGVVLVENLVDLALGNHIWQLCSR